MRSVTGPVAFVAAVACLVVACSDAPAVAPTSAPVQTAPTNVDPDIQTWISRSDGTTVEYDLELGCICLQSGSWHVVESDGEVVAAEYFGEREPAPPIDWNLRLTYALDLATRAERRPLVSNVSPSSILLEIDPDPDTLDDELRFDATGIVVSP